MQSQMSLGQTSIEKLRFDPKCRDDIPAILTGLQTLYLDQNLREQVVALLEKCISANTSLKHGRPGMDLWRIFVLGVLRLGADLDYDRLHDLANKHYDIRVMLLTGGFEGEKWKLETIQENVRLLTPEILDQINQIVVQSGHALVKKKDEEEVKLNARCDSFVVETNVHFPTDINLLYDAIRKVVKLMMRHSFSEGFRQSKHLLKKMKKLVRRIGVLRHSKRNPKVDLSNNNVISEKKQCEMKKNQDEFIRLHQELNELAALIIERSEVRLKDCKLSKNKEKIEYFITHAKRQIDQIKRRVLNEEKIPSEEKVYSIFEPHTEWISKGKAGVPQELGVRVSIIEDQYGFILNHAVMQKQTDDKVAVSIIESTKKSFSNLFSCSFDKGYHSPGNKKDLVKLLDKVFLPKKGKLSAVQLVEETSESFVQARNQHSAVESAINCLEHHGLDRCPDHGIDGFNRYISLAILARNIHQLGRVVRIQAQKKSRRKQKSLAA